ncbi:UNVERIFIED_CONTAM: hypothetical protein FKN15_075745 [Acipenser sinensis]
MGRGLYRWDRLHLNRRRSSTLGETVNRVIRQLKLGAWGAGRLEPRGVTLQPAQQMTNKIIKNRIGNYVDGNKNKTNKFNQIVANVQKLKCLYLNIKSIRNTFLKLEAIVNVDNCDIVGITESWLTPNDGDEFNMEG